MRLNSEIGKRVCRVNHRSICVKETTFKFNVSPCKRALVGNDSGYVNLAFLARRFFFSLYPINPGLNDLYRAEKLVKIRGRIYCPSEKSRDEKSQPEQEDEANASDDARMAKGPKR